VKKFISFVPLNLFCLLLLSGLGQAQTQTITGSSTTKVSLTAAGTLTLTSTTTLNVKGSGSGNVAVNVNDSTANDVITINNSGTLEQSGTVASGNGQEAISDGHGGVNIFINNFTGGLIQTTANSTILFSKSSNNITINNSGTINSLSSGSTSSSSSNQAIDLSGINTTGNTTINNNVGGLIEAVDGDAIRPGLNGVINNSGTIMSTNVALTKSDGIEATAQNGNTGNSGVVITNFGTGLISGARHGITGGNTDTTTSGDFTMSIVNQAGGIIKGNNGSGVNIDGFNANEVVTINNAGLISGSGTTLTGTSTSQDGDGVDVDGIVVLTNSGTIVSLNAINDTSEGVTVGGGTITNSGTIEGSVASPGGGNTAVGRGITLAGLDKNVSGTTIPIQGIYANTTVFNSGLIKGDTDSGIAILNVTGTTNNFSVTITNTAGGIITGSGTVAVIDGSGEGIASANNETVINWGTIQASGSGKAISLGSGNNMVEIMGGSASVMGDISGGTPSGTNTASLVIDPSAGQSFSYAGALSNFTSVQVASGTVTLSGTSTYTGSTTVTGGKLAVNGSITSNVAIFAGAELGGHGTISGTLSGAGSVGPGNSPGILTTTSVNPGSLTFNFEMTQTGTATWNNPSASGNDVLHLTAALPFTANLTSSNKIDVYFSGLNLTYEGGFFVEGSTDTLTSAIAGATFQYFLLDNTSGTVLYNGNKYDVINGTESTVQITAAPFLSGTVNGFTEQFTAQAAPEPSTYVLLGIGALGLLVLGRRRNRVG
jgi:hypothetical protein